MVPRRVKLRDTSKDHDVLSVSYRGKITFGVNRHNDLRGVDSALRFLSQNGFLHWEVDSGASEV